MERVNIEQLRKHANNRKNSFWIHNPETGESKMIFTEEEIPNGFIEGRKIEIKNTIDLLNVGDNSDLDLKKIKSEFSDIYFDNWYKRWVFLFKIDNKKNKITHIDYWTLVWARDSIINFYKLKLEKSELNFDDSKSKEDTIEVLKSFREYLKIDAGGSILPASKETVENSQHFVFQDGKTVFKYAVSGMADVSEKIMQRNNLSHDDINWLVAHQANRRIIDATANRMELDESKVLINIQKYGNTTSATLPLLLSDFENQLKKGDNLIFAAFGGGFTWGAIYLKWAYTK